jgi:hypothetical protein
VYGFIIVDGYALTVGLIVALLALDLVVGTVRPHRVGFREATVWSLFYIGVAVAFGLILAAQAGSRYAMQYFAGYLVEVPNASPESSIARGGAELFDPRMLIRWDHLIGQLPANPMRLLHDNDSAPEPGGRQCRSARAKPAPNNGDVGAVYLHVVSLAKPATGWRCRVSMVMGCPARRQADIAPVTRRRCRSPGSADNDPVGPSRPAAGAGRRRS